MSGLPCKSTVAPLPMGLRSGYPARTSLPHDLASGIWHLAMHLSRPPRTALDQFTTRSGCV